MFIPTNPNPLGVHTSDCVIRALAIAQDQSWEQTYIELSMQGFVMGDWGNANIVWSAYLKDRGFKRYAIPNTCPHCYCVKDFCEDHPQGTYILATGTHVVAVIDSNYYDLWDSGNEVPQYYWEKEM